MAGHYRPAGGTEVGGEPYDAVELPSGGMVAFVGDGMGLGMPAAAAMAQLRASLRAHVAVDPRPEVVFARLDAPFDRRGDARRFLASVESAKNVGSFVDPAAVRQERRQLR